MQVNGQWCSPVGATSGTYIFQLPLGVIANPTQVDMFDSVENEWLRAQITQALAPTLHLKYESDGGPSGATGLTLLKPAGPASRRPDTLGMVSKVRHPSGAEPGEPSVSGVPQKKIHRL
ncbi:hypothetical protein [Acidovorax sacchari]|uniref:hypothetical protein n=1 Tax=Acidovorax sacchari TaxID=3230736 RepID=UPI0039E2F3B7